MSFETAKDTEAGFVNLQETVIEPVAVDYTAMMDELRGVFESGLTKDLAWRKQQLSQVMKMCKERHADITAAINADHGGSKLRGLADTMTVFGDAELALANVDSWAAPETVPHDSMLGKSMIRKEPKGIVLNIAPWNYPVSLALQPMVAAIAAGNCCVIKPSEVSTHSATLISKLVAEYMDTRAIKCVEGGIPETQGLLDQRFDHIMYTGNGAVARIVMSKAAKHLTPVTLELGGKSPVYVDSTASIDATVNRISAAKWLNAGQTCVAPDYVLVHKSKHDELVKGLQGVINKDFSSNPKDSEFGRLINERHVGRVQSLLESTSGNVINGGLDTVDAAGHYIAPTLVLNPKEGEGIMKQEIFGPVLPILPVENEDEAISTINRVCNDPLALYVFSEDNAVVDKVLDSTNSGGVCVNSAMEHLGNHNLPFGGVGNSGTGAYHGKHGFDEFSHKRSVLYKDTTFTKGGFFPLKGGNDLYDIAVKLALTGIVDEDQKAKIKVAGAAIVAGALYYKFGRSKL